MARRKPSFGELKTEFVECRVLGHSWDDVSGSLEFPDVELLPKSALPKVFRCTRCTTIRYELWGAYGQLVYRFYRHPDGYSLGKTELPGEMTLREAMRVEKMGREKK